MKRLTFNQWPLWCLVATVQFYQGCLISFPSIMALQIKQTLLIDSSGLGVLFATFLLATLAIQIPGGILLDRFGSKKVMILLLILIIGSCLVFALSNQFYAVLIGILLLGSGTGMSYISVIHFSRSWLPPKDFSRSLYYTTTIGTAGFLTGSTTMAYLNRFQNLWLISSELAVIGLILLLLISLRVPIQTIATAHKNTYRFKEVFNVFTDKKVMLIGLYTGGIFCQYSVLSNMWRVPYLTSVLHIPIERATAYNNLTLVGFFLGCYACNLLRVYMKPTSIMLCAAVVQLIILNIIHLFPFNLFRIILLVLLGAVCAPTIFSYELMKECTPAKFFGIISGFLTILFDSFGTVLGYFLGKIPVADAGYLTKMGIRLISIANIIGLFALLGYVFIMQVKKNQANRLSTGISDR